MSFRSNNVSGNTIGFKMSLNSNRLAILFFVQGRHFCPLFPMLALFQDCSSDGPGQPSMQETLENKNSFKEKEAQDQGSTLRSQSRLSEVQQKALMHVTVLKQRQYSQAA